MKKFVRLVLLESAGWYGVAAVLLAYILGSLNILDTKSLFYHLLNLTGAVGIAIDAYGNKNIQPIILNLIWGVVALVALLKIFATP